MKALYCDKCVLNDAKLNWRDNKIHLRKNHLITSVDVATVTDDNKDGNSRLIGTVKRSGLSPLIC